MRIGEIARLSRPGYSRLVKILDVTHLPGRIHLEVQEITNQRRTVQITLGAVTEAPVRLEVLDEIHQKR